MSVERFRDLYVVPAPGRVLIAGSAVYGGKPDRRAAFADALGVDMLPGRGVDRVLDLEGKLPASLGTFSHIECTSVLEHSKRPWLLAANLERLLAPGGTLFVSVPFAWRVHAYPSDYWRMTPEALSVLFPTIEWVERAFVHYGVSCKRKIRHRKDDDGHPYIARTETCGFGVMPS